MAILNKIRHCEMLKLKKYPNSKNFEKKYWQRGEKVVEYWGCRESGRKIQQLEWVEGFEKVLKKFLRNFQKPIDKRKELWYNNRVAAKKATATKRAWKKLKKVLKNLLTNRKGCGIIDRLSRKWVAALAKVMSDWNLTIEQQKIEVQSKFSKCEYKICQNQEKYYSF